MMPFRGPMRPSPSIGYTKICLHEDAKTIGTTSEEIIRSAGFDIIANATKKLPNHHRIIHPDGVAGFTDESLAKLAQVFTNTTGH